MLWLITRTHKYTHIITSYACSRWQPQHKQLEKAASTEQACLKSLRSSSSSSSSSNHLLNSISTPTTSRATPSSPQGKHLRVGMLRQEQLSTTNLVCSMEHHQKQPRQCQQPLLLLASRWGMLGRVCLPCHQWCLAGGRVEGEGPIRWVKH